MSRAKLKTRAVGGLVALLILVAGIVVYVPAAAANSITVTPWNCPVATDPATDSSALPATCPEQASDITFALTAGGLTRRRVATAGSPASWPAVAGQYVLSIDSPTGEPAVVVCDQAGIGMRFDAPGGVVNGDLPSGVSLNCQWYRLPAGGTAAPTPAAPSPVASPNAQLSEFTGRVDIGGRSLFLQCVGTGSPTVLLESGGPKGSFSSRWSVVQPEVAKLTRVCSYDRAGVGQSDPAPAGIRTMQDSVNDLRALLSAMPIGCPCVMAGESWGGSILRLYASQFPTDVAGLVLIDAMPPGFIEQFLKLVASSDNGFSNLMGADNKERMDQLNSFRQADKAATPPNLPMLVITHGLFLGFPLNFPVDQLEREWKNDQEAYASANHAVLRVARTSGNSVVRDQPQLVIDSIDFLVDAVRHAGSLQPILVINREDANGNPLSGSCFQIYADAGGGTRGEFRGGACDADKDKANDGVIEFDPMPAGNYVLQEAKAPDGVPALADAAVTLSGLATTVILQPPPVATPVATATVPVTPTPK